MRCGLHCYCGIINYLNLKSKKVDGFRILTRRLYRLSSFNDNCRFALNLELKSEKKARCSSELFVVRLIT
jgi:hypothetical protein